MKEDKNEELQSRRSFFKNAAKAALPILGAVVLAHVPLVAKAASSTGCNSACTNSCSGMCLSGCSQSCYGGCSRGCSQSCKTDCSIGCQASSNGSGKCMGCEGYCWSSCSGYCSSSCKGSCRDSNYMSHVKYG